VILEHHLDPDSSESKSDFKTPQNEKMLQEVFAYARAFDNYKNKEAIKDAREMLAKKYPKLDTFEVACINNLNIDSAEEAYSLIPTLKAKFPEKELLDDLLQDLKRYQSS